MFDRLSLLSGSAERDHRLAGLFLGLFGLDLDDSPPNRDPVADYHWRLAEESPEDRRMEE